MGSMRKSLQDCGRSITADSHSQTQPIASPRHPGVLPLKPGGGTWRLPGRWRRGRGAPTVRLADTSSLDSAPGRGGVLFASPWLREGKTHQASTLLRLGRSTWQCSAPSLRMRPRRRQEGGQDSGGGPEREGLWARDQGVRGVPMTVSSPAARGLRVRRAGSGPRAPPSAWTAALFPPRPAALCRALGALAWRVRGLGVSGPAPAPLRSRPGRRGWLRLTARGAALPCKLQSG